MVVNVAELEELARKGLDGGAFDYYAGGAGDEVTLRENRAAWDRLRLRYRVLVDVSARDLSIELLGQRLGAPFLLAPTALHRLAHPEGEVATARAAGACGVLMTLSSITSVPLQEVSAAATGPLWFQLYDRDPELTGRLVAMAEEAGFSALVLTVDTPLLGRRERDLRNDFTLPDGVSAVHFPAHGKERGKGLSVIASYIHQPAVTWKDVEALRRVTRLPIVLKGIVRGDDAARAIDVGAAAVWVSNHGGRQLDSSIPTAEALPDVVASVGGRVPIIVDGGVRRGTDVLKALALGASAVALGRAQLWALASGGEDGVRAMLEMVRDELSLAMALAGCRSVTEIDRSLVCPVSQSRA